MARLFSESFESFTAAGFSPIPTTGQLDSDVWRVGGFSDNADPAYGFTGAAGSDFGRGQITTTDVSAGGIYAPASGTGTGPALVAQPTAGEFRDNGFFEARIVNDTGAAITGYTVDFDWIFRNTGAATNTQVSNLAFSYSTNNGASFTTVPAAGFATPGQSVPNSTFQSSGVDPVDISGVSVAAGDALLIRWTHTSSAGSGNRDEVGIDNVTVDSVDAPSSGASLSIAAANASIAEGNAGTTAFTFTVTRSGDTTIASTADFAVSGSGANAADAADFGGALPNGQVAFAAGEISRTITVEVSGDAAIESDETFTVTLTNPSADTVIGTAAVTGTIVTDDRAVTLISAVQGTATTQTNDGFGALSGSPLRGQTVTVEAIVVGDFQNGDADVGRNLQGFYVQEELADEDGNPLSSEGMFIFEGSGAFRNDFNTGDRVQITGVVEENFGLTRINVTGSGASTVLLEAGAVADIDTMAASVTLPAAATTLSQNGDVQPDLEAYEGMLVRFENTMTITEQFQLDRFNEIKLFDTNGFTQTGADGTTITGERPFQFTQYNAPDAAGLAAYSNEIGARTITYDDGLNTQNNAIDNLDGFQGYSTDTAPRMGNTITGLTGILDYQFAGNAASGSTWRVRSIEDGTNAFADANPRVDTPIVAEGDLKVASFNVLNFFTTLDNGGTIENGMDPRGPNNAAEAQRQLDKLVTAILALDADILGLVEIENDFIDAVGETTPIGTLVNALNAASGTTDWAFVNPGVDQLGGDAIAVGAIYRTDKVRIAEGTTAATLSDDSPEAQAVIAASNGGTTAIFDGAGASRQPLAVTFEEIASGEELTVVVNHFKSKGSAGPAAGDADAGDGQGFSNETRLNSAKALEAWLEGNPTGSATDNVLLLGDLNSYAAEDPIQYLLDNGFVDAAAEFLDNAYSYLFDGLLGTLDYALASMALFDNIVSAVEAHLNSDEADALDYNTDFARDPSYFDGESPFRVSDHDPVVVGINLSEAPVANFQLQILHQSDGEAGLLAPDTAPNLAALIDAFEDDYANTLNLSGGDNFLPGPFGAAGTDPSLNAILGGSTAFFRPDIAIQNALGVEVSAIGNHEFDLGSNVFNDAMTANGNFAGANFALVSANLNFAGDSALRGRADQSLGGTTGNDFAGDEASTIAGRITPWTTVTKGGERIGILGATTQVLERISSPSGTEVLGFPTAGQEGDNVEVDDMDLLASQLQPIIDQMIASGINKIVLQSHLQDLNNERILATKLSGVDIILAAGSNTRLGDANDTPASFPGHNADFADTYPVVTQGLDGNTTLIVNTDNEYTYLGRLVVEFDANGEIVVENLDSTINGAYAATTENVAAAWSDTDGDLSDTAFAEGTRGETVQDITGAVEAVLLAKDGTFYGYSNVYLEGERNLVRSQETNFGNLSADANRDAAATALGSEQPFVVSLKNGGGIRAQIGSISSAGGSATKLPTIANPEAGKPAGAISQLDIENALRFDNKLMVFDTTAQGLLNILDFAAGIPNNNGGFPQVGGLRYSYDEGAPSGSRIKNVAITDENGVTAKIVENGVIVAGAPAVISVVTLNFTANGGDGYPVKANGENFRYLLADGTLSAPVNESLDFAAPANVPANALGEQAALAEHLRNEYATPGNAFNAADVPEAQDGRIQNLDLRSDTVFQTLEANGDDAANTILGTESADFVQGGAGNDLLGGFSSTDGLYGGVGDDALYGGRGADYLFGEDGDDQLVGEQGIDAIFGGTGRDAIYGGTEGDYLYGEAGVDGIHGEAGNDIMFGGADGDYLYGGNEDDVLYGEAGVDALFGQSGNDTVIGGDDGDYLYGEAGIDRLYGEAGSDALFGGDGDDMLYGQDGIDYLYGEAGNDLLESGAGNDVLYGGAGNDVLVGGLGSDFIYFDGTFGLDTVTDFSRAEGDRLVFSAAEVNPQGGVGLQYYAQADTTVFSVANLGQVYVAGLADFSDIVLA